MFLGRVTPYKGPAVAIEALALLRSEHGVHANLAIVGPEDDAYGAQLRRLADRLGVAAAVSWPGQATPEQAAATLARAHALIVPSTWDEPFGLVMIEGALARVPLVASDVGGIGESMRDEEHALLFARGDAGAAAAALARTLQEREATAARVPARLRSRSGLSTRPLPRGAGTLRARRARGPPERLKLADGSRIAGHRRESSTSPSPSPFAIGTPERPLSRTPPRSPPLLDRDTRAPCQHWRLDGHPR